MPLLLTYTRQPDRSSKASSIGDEIDSYLAAGKTHSFIYVVPTRRKLRDLQRLFLRRTPPHVAPQYYLYTLDLLAQKLHKRCCPPRLRLSGPMQAVIIETVIAELLEQQKLAYFHTSVRPGDGRLPSGTFQKIINVINKLKESGLYLEAFEKKLSTCKHHEREKLQDIFAIAKGYEKRIADRFVDLGGLYKELNVSFGPLNATGVFRSTFDEGVEKIFIEGFAEFSEPELAMIETLKAVEGISVLLSFDFDPGNAALFGHLQKNYERLQSFGFIPAGASTRNPDNDGSSLRLKHHCTNFLFAGRDRSPAAGFADSVSLFPVQDRYEEVETIAKIIKLIMKENPARDLSRICVATFRTERYTELLRDAFLRFRIPANITDRFVLDRSPLFTSILSILKIVEQDFRRHDILRALASPYFLFRSPQGRIDAGVLYEVSRRLKIVGGAKSWREKIAKRLRALKELAETSLEEEDQEEIDRERRELLKAANDIEYLVDLLLPLRKPMTLRAALGLLKRLLGDLGVEEKILAVRDGPPSLSADAHLERDVRAYAAMVKMFDDLCLLEEFQHQQDTTHDIFWLVERLTTGSEQTRYNVRYQYGKGVLVTSMEETRGIQCDVMIIAGLVDGEFPSVYQPEVFFSDEIQHEQEEYHLTRERFLFYQAITNWNESLVLLYPKQEGETELVQSTFLDSLLAIAGVNTRLPLALEDTIFTAQELHRRYGEHIARDGTDAGSVFDGLPEPYRSECDRIRTARLIETSRSLHHELKQYEGSIFDALGADLREKLQAFREKIYSVSQLETYGKCGFQFFADRVLGIKKMEDLDEGLSSLERGSLVHEILFEFYLGRRSAGKPALPDCTEEQFLEAVEELKRLAERKLESYDVADLFWEMEKEALSGGGGRPGILEMVLKVERQRRLTVHPAYFEVRFGEKAGSKRASDPLLVWKDAVSVGEIKMRGRVDRIEIGEGIFTIIDYKTGQTIPHLAEMKDGMSLQLPLYMQAVKTILSKTLHRELLPVGGEYFRIHRPVKFELGVGVKSELGKSLSGSKSRQVVPTEADLSRLIEQSIGYAEAYVERISSGEFPLVKSGKLEEVCAFCPYKTMCRIQSKHRVESQVKDR